MSNEEIDALATATLGGLFLWVIIWEVFFIALHVVIANRFERGVWKWGILGFLFGIFSLIWLIALGKKSK